MGRVDVAGAASLPQAPDQPRSRNGRAAAKPAGHTANTTAEHNMRRRGEAEEKYPAAGFGSSSGEDSFAMFTPRRTNTMSFGEELGTAGRNQSLAAPFDSHLQSGGRNPFAATAEASFGGGGFGFGERSGSSFGERSASSFGAFGTSSGGSKFAPRSLADASKGARAAQEAAAQAQPASHLSPAQHSQRVLRSASNFGGMTFAGGPSAGIPSQSLRDSPFMRAPAPAAAPSSAARNVLSTPAAASTLGVPAARLSTPFESEASPMRPAVGASAAKPRNASAAADDEEHKESDGQARTLFPEASTALAPWQSPAPASAVAVAASQPTGLGYAPSSDPCSVTVFGFGAADTSRVLQRFLSFGEVLQREDGAQDLGAARDGAAVGGGHANWMHLRYRTPVAAQMALAHNGRVLPGAHGQPIMVGVKPRTRAIDEACDGVPGLAHQRDTHAPHERHAGGVFEQSAKKRAVLSSRQLSAGAGALTAASIYAAPQATHPSSLRKSCCTKLMEYLFGW